MNLYRKAMKNAGVRRVAIVLSVRGSRKIDEMALQPLVVKCLRLLRGGGRQIDRYLFTKPKVVFEPSKGRGTLRL